jgi:hypothetical protein
MVLHFILYSNNEPFHTTKRLTINSIPNFTNQDYVIHDYTFQTIQDKDWFQALKDLPSIQKPGRRDGYYNCWKPFITKEVYDTMKEGDLLYYLDSSQYFKTGFTEPIDRLCEIARKTTCIAGSIGRDILNSTINCCDTLAVWDILIPNTDNTVYLFLPHVLNSWYIFGKSDTNKAFLEEWVKYSTYELNGLPLVCHHHTADQSLFNILVIKYKLPVFFCYDVLHNVNKNKNRVLQIINAAENPDEYFINLV